MKQTLKSVFKILAYVAAVFLLMWVCVTLLTNGSSRNPNPAAVELYKKGTTAETTDKALLAELSAQVNNQANVQTKSANGTGIIIPGATTTVSNIVLGDIAIAKKYGDRSDVLTYAQVSKKILAQPSGRDTGKTGTSAYLLHFVETDGQLKFASAVEIGPVTEIVDMKTTDINDADTGQEYSVILTIPPAVASSTVSVGSSSVQYATYPRHFAVTVVNGKLAEDTVEIN